VSARSLVEDIAAAILARIAPGRRRPLTDDNPSDVSRLVTLISHHG
jgi:hypothetical protein